MKVLFVYRGEARTNRNSVIDAQIQSLQKMGLIVIRAPISKAGVVGYLSSIKKIRRAYYTEKPDVVHSHYSLSAMATFLAVSRAKQVVSLMGSDVNQANMLMLRIINFMAKHVWRVTIVKSHLMQRKVPNSHVIPNGVDLDLFQVIDHKYAQSVVGFDTGDFNVIFVCENPKSANKNLLLAKEAVALASASNVCLKVISGKDQSELVMYYNAADMLLMTSIFEGSPNVVKEALACNCPIVTTDVGDVMLLLSGVENCFVTESTAIDIAASIDQVVISRSRSNGRLKIVNLSSQSVALKLICLYKKAKLI